MEEISMDKNNCDNNSYFYERNYYKDVPIKDTQILEYWNNILGKDVIELIDKAYGVSIEQILFSEYSLNHKYISFATLNQEYSDMCNEKAISYLTKKGTKVLFVLHDDSLLVKKVNMQTFAEITAPLKEEAKKIGIKESSANDIVQNFRKSKR